MVDCLNGFSPNVQDIIDNFKFRNQLPILSKADALGTLISKFLDPEIDLSPATIDNHGMGIIFEELVRRFNEENNEEAGEHWTPARCNPIDGEPDLSPVANEIRSGSYLLYDGAIGTGGMLTIAEETLVKLARERGMEIKTAEQTNCYATASFRFLSKERTSFKKLLHLGSAISELK